MALIQVGIMARRSPTGDFLPANPIYHEIASKDQEENEYMLLDELAEIFADKFEAYKAASSRRKRKGGYI